NVRFIDSDSAEVQALKPLEPKQTRASEDQNKTVKAIIRVVKGHRRRPLVITADRGRGKSAALGIAAAQLHQQGCQNIIVCAPSKKTAAVVFQYAKDTPLQYYSPDELQQQKPQADLLLIDEAAAIPVPLLIDFVKHYSRLVFATTQHGYEGSGRGFALSFKKVLNKVAPEWKGCELKTPIRWRTNDLLEQFVYQSLLLNAEVVDIDADAELVTTAKPENCQFVTIHKKQLWQNERLLKEIFGLLVNAHYQTKPSDFRQMLDDTNIQIFTLQHRLHEQKHIIAVSLVAEEGGIDNDLAEKIFSGTRRIKGHLVAQALAANVGLPEAPCLHGQRILRIAVHPSLQQQGFGTHLLKCLNRQRNKENQLDYLSTSFGATNSLLHFWQKSGFTPVYLSMKRDASSGTHSVLMLNAQSQSGKRMQSTARQHFIQSFPHLLSDPFRHLESDIAFELLQTSDLAPEQASEKIALTENDKRIIVAFAKAQRGYENSLYPIWKLVLTRLSLLTTEELTKNEKAIIILKVLQKHSWKTCCSKLEGTINSKKSALFLLRKCAGVLIEK
ncbi:MAG TPA: tRNA(Met) cytidine acetyltransferase, partial [Leucothrix sp.]|nr:tRNA(Met) cytidine acetyltransferase [Leucothrix sp.]